MKKTKMDMEASGFEPWTRPWICVILEPKRRMENGSFVECFSLRAFDPKKKALKKFLIYFFFDLEEKRKLKIGKS